jgi:hypothetical protein
MGCKASTFRRYIKGTLQKSLEDGGCGQYYNNSCELACKI